MAASASHEEQPRRTELWPVFICYRQVDGLAAARRLHELLDKRQVTGPTGELIEFDVYLDQTMPAVADWREIHRPYLERARALIVVCTPGAKIVEGEADWVHKEIGWWMEHRDTAPILIDPLRQGIRYVPDVIRTKWPEIQRIALVEAEWTHLLATELEGKAIALRRQIIGNILPSGAAIYDAEVKAERKRAEAERTSRRVSDASLHDAQAASSFEEARRHDARWDTARQRQIEISRAITALPETRQRMVLVRRRNLVYEYNQLNEPMRELAARAAAARRKGYADLKTADEAWRALAQEGHQDRVAARKRPDPPAIFSIELINAGRGESILIHYGTPDETRLVMVNGGNVADFGDTVAQRLHQLQLRRFRDVPVPIELFVASDQDEHKTGGLMRLLSLQVGKPKWRMVAFNGIWLNAFAASGFRGELRRLIAKARIPLNAPFDHLVQRAPDRLVRHCLPGGLEIVVLGPEQKYLRALYDLSRKGDAGRRKTSAPPISSFPVEGFSRVVEPETTIALRSTPVVTPDTCCTPSQNAKEHARLDAKFRDQSIPNLASTVLLFTYGGKTFLHTGDSRADLILDGLHASGLKKPGASAHVDLLLLPHLGSARNVTSEFLESVTADSYLFSGDGTFQNPSIEAIAALITARPCADYTMYFVNRDSRVAAPVRGRKGRRGAGRTHSENLDIFFAAEEQYNPRYRRVFRATDQGSVVIDLLDRLTY